MDAYPTTRVNSSRLAAIGDAFRTVCRHYAGKFMTEEAAVLRQLSKADSITGLAAMLLINGESGIDGEVLAQRLHDHSPRCGVPVFRLNYATRRLTVTLKGCLYRCIHCQQGYFPCSRWWHAAAG